MAGARLLQTGVGRPLRSEVAVGQLLPALRERNDDACDEAESAPPLEIR